MILRDGDLSCFEEKMLGLCSVGGTRVWSTCGFFRLLGSLENSDAQLPLVPHFSFSSLPAMGSCCSGIEQWLSPRVCPCIYTDIDILSNSVEIQCEIRTLALESVMAAMLLCSEGREVFLAHKSSSILFFLPSSCASLPPLKRHHTILQ